jgi:hypothetical protein
MVSLAEVQTVMGQEAPAKSRLTLAARWGNTEAIDMLKLREQPVPKADLYETTITQQNLERMRATGAMMRQPIRHINQDRVSDDDR